MKSFFLDFVNYATGIILNTFFKTVLWFISLCVYVGIWFIICLYKLESSWWKGQLFHKDKQKHDICSSTIHYIYIVRIINYTKWFQKKNLFEIKKRNIQWVCSKNSFLLLLTIMSMTSFKRPVHSIVGYICFVSIYHSIHSIFIWNLKKNIVCLLSKFAMFCVCTYILISQTEMSQISQQKVPNEHLLKIAELV